MTLDEGATLAFRALFFFSSRRRHTSFDCDWSSDVCSSDLHSKSMPPFSCAMSCTSFACSSTPAWVPWNSRNRDRKSTRLNSSHSQISYAVFCLKKKKKNHNVIIILSTPLRHTFFYVGEK